jgi:lytic murein transglycosylase
MAADVKSSFPLAAVLQAGIWAAAAALSPALSQVTMPAMSAQAPVTTAVQAPTDALPAFPAGGVVQSLPARPPEPTGAGFPEWLAGFRARAQAAGIRTATLDRELAGLTFNPRVIQLDRAQGDDSSAAPPLFADYYNRRVPARVDPGRTLRRDLSPRLVQIEARFGVPAGVLVAIWGLESAYGANAGNFDLVRSLASLAFDGRRAALFEGELLAALRLIDEGRVARGRLVGSWAGATGMPQFLPSSYARWAVDGDGDGRADIWGNEVDTLASIANYLAGNGWPRGQRWGLPVVAPGGLDRSALARTDEPTQCRRPLARHSRWLTLAEWRSLGFVPATGGVWPRDDTLSATLIEPDGPGGPAFLTFEAYRAILAYNCSNYYALTVGLLADRL